MSHSPPNHQPEEPKTNLTVLGGPAFILPALIVNAGENATKRFLEFFAAHIRNKHTRAAYARAVGRFLSWCEARGLSLLDIEPIIVAAYIEGHSGSAPTQKQHLAAIKMLFDWLLLGQVVPSNPAASVRGPKHVVNKGKTPILEARDTRHLFNSIVSPDNPNPSLLELRDRALIAVMVFTFARISAVLAMNVDDYYPNGKRWWLRFREKGGKQHEMPAQHLLEEYLDAYLTAAGITGDAKGPIFRTAGGRKKVLTATRLNRNDAYKMIRRRAKQAGIKTVIGCHTFRGTGITNYLSNGGTLEKAQQMAAHASSKTTMLYDRRIDEVTLDEVERIII